MQLRKSVLITGGSGYLGQHLTAKAIQTYSVHATYHNHPANIKAGHPIPLDLTNRAAVLRLTEMLAPQAIIHLAAVNPGGDEQDMVQVNVDGARYIAEGSVEIGARLIYVSTDMVHNGQHAPYDDDAPPAPINLYGRSKAAAETAISKIDPSAAIVRTSLIYGLEQMDRGTAGFAKRLQSRRPLVLFNDVIRQPVWVESLNKALLKLVDLDFAGRLNVVGRQALNREQFGRLMLDWWQVNHRGLLKSGRARDVSQSIPLDLRLTVTRAEQLLQMSFPGVDEVLAMHPPSS